jgi:hypothetical protein
MTKQGLDNNECMLMEEELKILANEHPICVDQLESNHINMKINGGEWE